MPSTKCGKKIPWKLKTSNRKYYYFIISYFLLPIGIVSAIIDDPTDEADVIGVRIDTSEAIVRFEPNGEITILPNMDVEVRLFGQKLDEVETIFVTTSSEECTEHVRPVIPRESFEVLSKNTLKFTYNFPYELESYYFCFNWIVRRDGSSNDHGAHGLLGGLFGIGGGGNNGSAGGASEKASIGTAVEMVHQGNKDWQFVKTHFTPTPAPEPVRTYYMPVPLQIIVICLLLVLSGLFSGLNLGLMSLDKTELEIILKVGEKRERAYAEKIYPIRKTGNYLLCTLLFGNVLVNSAVSILMDDLTSGFVALIAASFGIVVFAVGAYTIYLTRFFMILTAPLSWPISKVLDKVLGEEVGSVYNKERLLELIRMSKDCQAELQDCQEVQIVTGALELSKKRVRDVMTNIRDVYMLPSETILDPLMVSEIVKSGYTRIPVYESSNRHNIVAVLNVKDLALLDPEDKIPLTTICKFYQRTVRFVMEDTPLNLMLEEFKKGHYHLAMVQRINAEGDGDPTYEVVGLISLEDILEEIIQAEIMDEFDVVRNDRRRPRRKDTLAAAVAAKDVTSFFYNPDADLVDLSPQLSLATYQYLSTTFDAFRVDVISDHVLQRLIKQNAVRTRPGDAYETERYLYQKGKECDYFMLILEGKATINVGESEMLFEPGPFHYFGYEVVQRMFVQAPRFSIVQVENKTSSSSPLAGLIEATNVATSAAAAVSTSSPRRYTFVPDFTLKVTHELVYLKITASTYMKAFRATLVERRGSLSLYNPQSVSMSLLNSPSGGATSYDSANGMIGSNNHQSMDGRISVRHGISGVANRLVHFDHRRGSTGLESQSPKISASSPVIDQSDRLSIDEHEALKSTIELAAVKRLLSNQDDENGGRGGSISSASGGQTTDRTTTGGGENRRRGDSAMEDESAERRSLLNKDSSKSVDELA